MFDIALPRIRNGEFSNPLTVRTPLVEKQIPEQASCAGDQRSRWVKKVMLQETVDGEFTTVQDVAQIALPDFSATARRTAPPPST